MKNRDLAILFIIYIGMMAILILWYFNAISEMFFYIFTALALAALFVLTLTIILSRTTDDTLANLKYNYMSSTKSVLVELDINNFRMLTLVYGVEKMNEVVSQLKQSILYIFPDATLYTKYTDHFIFCTHITNKKDIKNAFTEIQRKIKENEVDNIFSIGLSCGVYYPNYKEDFEQALDNVYLAFKNSKQSIKNSISFYEPNKLEGLIEENKNIKETINHILNKNFQIYYQPKYDTKTQNIIGSEALIRLVAETGEVISPSVFIPIAEKNGLVTYIDRYVIKQVCIFINKLKKENIKFGTISVNLSRASLTDDDLIDFLEKLFARYGIEKNDIELEITEGAEGQGNNFVQDFIEVFGNKYRIAIDDFGTGYSSLEFLKASAIKTIKIDKCFIDDKSASGRKILTNLIELAKELKYETICEGVEKQEDYDFLKKINCDYIQGFYFSKPLQENEYIELLKK